MGELAAEARRHLAAGKFLVTLGGEHSLTQAPVAAARQVFGEIGVVQFDAHADLREEFEGTPFSHASVMKRVVDLGVPTLAVGIRSLSEPEARLVDERRLPVVWGHEMERAAERFPAMLARLPERVYLTFDVDYFDPALVPATGTPEPGGGTWHPTLALLRQLFRDKTVVAMDVVELAPIGGQPASDFLAAKLIYKCLGYLQEKEAGKEG
jgi:agmatinase